MKILTEKEAETFLEKQGFKVVKRTFARKLLDLKKIKIKFPWVMKVSSRKIVHKAKIGGVILNIKSLNQAEKEYNKLSRIDGFQQAIIQPQIKGKELILGLKNTPEFGTVLMFGKGGSNVEKEKDISFRILPITKKDAKQMLSEIKYLKKIKKQINQKKVIENLLKLSKISQKYKNIVELDINPLFINAHQALIADARIIFN